jgi:hypothetical protein
MCESIGETCLQIKSVLDVDAYERDPNITLNETAQENTRT